MAVFSKLFKSAKKFSIKTLNQTPPSSSCDHPLKNLRVKAKLLLPLVSLPDVQPALALFKAGICEKKKRKPTVTMTLSHDCISLRNHKDWAVTEAGDALLKFPYESIVTVVLTERKSEVAIVCKRPDNHYWCACLNLKTARTKGLISRTRKITGKEVQRVIERLQSNDDFSGLSKELPPLISQSNSFFYIDCSNDHLRSRSDETVGELLKESSMLSIVSSDSFYYIDYSKDNSQPELNYVDNDTLEKSITPPLIVSCSSILTAISEQTNDECNNSISDQSEQEEETIDFDELFYQHCECCIKPCGEDCPMFPVATAAPASNQRQQFRKPTLSTPLSFYNPQQQPAPYSYYWDHNTGSYQLLPAVQPQPYGYSPADGQYTDSPLILSTGYLNVQVHNSIYAHDYYNAYVANMYRLYSSAGYEVSSTPDQGLEMPNDYYNSYVANMYQLYSSAGYEVPSTPDQGLEMPMSDRKKRKMLREQERSKAALQEILATLAASIQPTYTPDTNSYYQGNGYQQSMVNLTGQVAYNPYHYSAPAQYQESPSQPPTVQHDQCSANANSAKYDTSMIGLLKYAANFKAPF